MKDTPDIGLLAEKVETLDGSRSSRPMAKDRRAVRVEDLAPLTENLTRLESETVSAAPSADDFNALVRDVHRIFDMLAAISQRVK